MLKSYLAGPKLGGLNQVEWIPCFSVRYVVVGPHQGCEPGREIITAAECMTAMRRIGGFLNFGSIDPNDKSLRFQYRGKYQFYGVHANLTLHMMSKMEFQPVIFILRCLAFQICLTLWGQKWTTWPREIFKKMPRKQRFGRHYFRIT